MGWFYDDKNKRAINLGLTVEIKLELASATVSLLHFVGMDGKIRSLTMEPERALATLRELGRR